MYFATFVSLVSCLCLYNYNLYLIRKMLWDKRSTRRGLNYYNFILISGLCVAGLHLTSSPVISMLSSHKDTHVQRLQHTHTRNTKIITSHDNTVLGVNKETRERKFAEGLMLF